MINKIVRRNILRNKFMIIGIIVLMVFSLSLINLSFSNAKKMQINYDAVLEKSNAEDFKIITNGNFFYSVKDKDAYVAQLENKYPVQVETYEIFSTKYKVGDKKYTQDVIKYDPNHKINVPIMDQGKLPLNEGEVIVNKGFAELNDLNVGDQVEIEGVEYSISGLGNFGNFIGAYGTQSAFPSVETSAMILMNKETFENRSMQGTFIPFTFIQGQFNEENLSNKKQMALMDKITKESTFKVPLLDVNNLPQVDEKGKVIYEDAPVFAVGLSGFANAAVTSYKGEISGNQTMLRVLTAIFLFIAILLAIIFYRSLLKKQTREIGILKAEGYSTKEIGKGFKKSIWVIVVINTFFGVLLGLGLRSVMVAQYKGVYDIPTDAYNKGISTFLEIYGGDIIVYGILGLIVVNVVYYLGVKKGISLNPLMLIKNITKEKKPRFSIGKYTTKLPFKSRYKMNILMRNFKLVLLLIFGVFVSAFLMLLSSVLLNTTQSLISDIFDEQFTMDYFVYFSKEYEAPEDKFNDSSIISNETTISAINGEKVEGNDKYKGKNTSADLEGVSPQNKYLNFKDKEGKKVPDSAYKDGIVISEFVVKQFDVKMGDTITFVNPYNVKENLTYKVTGIFGYQFGEIYETDISQMQKDLGVSDKFYNGQMGKGDLEEYYKNVDPFSQYANFKDIKESLNNGMKSAYAIVYIFVVIGAIMSFIVLNIIVTLIVSSNKKTISMMKVLGYRSKEVTNMIIGSFKWIVIATYLLTIPIIIQLITKIIEFATADLDVEFNVVADNKTAIIGLLAIVFVYFLSSKIALRKIRKTNLSESLKSDD